MALYMAKPAKGLTIIYCLVLMYASKYHLAVSFKYILPADNAPTGEYIKSMSAMTADINKIFKPVRPAASE